MSIRIVVIALICAFLCYYAWRNCFVSACASVVLMAIMQHPDVLEDLKSIGGIQGLNVWNLLMFNVIFAWLHQRSALGFTWDFPRGLQIMFCLYMISLVISVLRLLIDPTGAPPRGFGEMVSEYLINSFKWVLPGIVLFDLSRTRRRVQIAMVCIASMYFLLAIQVINHVPLAAAADSSFQIRAYKLIQNAVGYNRVTLSMMLGGASWAMLGLLVLAEKKWQKMAIVGAGLTIALGQALTGGRSGYLSWGIVGLVLCITRWRKLLPLIPTAVILVCIFLPAVRDRMLMGIDGEEKDVYEATSGRNIAWPYVIDQIKESPIHGHGREGMSTSGVFGKILIETENTESFPHPHNAYLEVLLDMGLIGFFCVVPFYLITLLRAFGLFLDKGDPIFAAAGGMACALMLALLVAAMGGQTFYPREGSVGMWAAIGVMMRVYVERARALQYGEALFGEDEEVLEAEIIDDSPDMATA